MSEARELTREYSERLGLLRAGQLQAAADRFDLGTVLEAAPAPGGLFGQNVFLTTTGGAWVLRGAPHTDWQLPKERFVAGLVREHTDVPVPWPYEVEESAEIFGWPFAVMPRLPGVHEAAHGREDGRAYARALGDALARFHAIRADEPGYYHPESRTVVPYPVGHAERVVGQLHEWCESVRAIGAGHLRDEDEEWIEQVVAADRSALEEPYEPCWLHHDWKPNNVLAERSGSGWRVTGVVDLAEGYFGDGEEDLVRTVAVFATGDRGRARRFVSAYRERRPLRAGFAERHRIYQLIDCLVLWEYGRRNGLWFPQEARFHDYARNFVEVVRPF